MKNKKAILKKACGKGGPMEGIKNTASGIVGAAKNVAKIVGSGARGAISSYSDTRKADQKNLGFSDPGAYLNAGVRGLMGGVAAAAKKAKDLSDKKPKAIPAIKRVAPSAQPLKTSVPLQNKPRTSMPINAPTSLPAKKTILKKKLV